MFVCPSAESGARRSPAQHFGRIMTERVGRLPWLWSRPFLATPPKNARGGRIGCRVPEQHDLDRSGDPLSTPGGHLEFRDRAQSPMANVRRAQCSAPSNKGLSRGLAEDAGELQRAEISTDPWVPTPAPCPGSIACAGPASETLHDCGPFGPHPPGSTQTGPSLSARTSALREHTALNQALSSVDPTAIGRSAVEPVVPRRRSRRVRLSRNRPKLISRSTIGMSRRPARLPPRERPGSPSEKVAGHSARLRKRTPRPPPELGAPSLMNSIPAASRAVITFVRLSITPRTVPLLASMR